MIDEPAQTNRAWPHTVEVQGEFGLDVAARKIDPLVLTGDRLAPDVFPLHRQVQIACCAAKNGLVRLSGADAPKFEDTETSFAELKQRIASTLACIDSVPADKLDGTEDKSITFSVGKDATRTMAGFDYLTGWILRRVRQTNADHGARAVAGDRAGPVAALVRHHLWHLRSADPGEGGLQRRIPAGVLPAARTEASRMYNGYGFGRGWAVRTEETAKRIPGSIGDFAWSGASGTYFWVDPKERLVAMFLTQPPGTQTDPLKLLARQQVYGELR